MRLQAKVNKINKKLTKRIEKHQFFPKKYVYKKRELKTNLYALPRLQQKYNTL